MFFTDSEDYTKFGYFEVGGTKTFSKYEAWQVAQQCGAPVEDIKFSLGPALDQIDWTTSPTDDLRTLYGKRARQLREKYDHLVLLYSGGIDSHVILNTFLEQNIKLDDIITIGNRKYQPDTAKINQEVFGKAIPYIDLMRPRLAGTEFTYVDIGQLIVDQYSDQHHFDNFMYYNNGPLSPWCVAFRSHLFKLQNTKHVQLSKEGKTICYIWGYDKPNLYEENGNWCFKFADSVSDFAARAYNNKELVGGALKNFTDEPFFITPDMPEIVIRQCHDVAKVLNSITNQFDSRLCSVDRIPNTGPFIEHPIGRHLNNGKWMKKKELERIVYPDEDVNTFGDDKVRGSVMFTTRDRWFFQSTFESRNKLIKKYKRLFREHEDYFRFNIDGVAINSIALQGKPFIICKSTT